MLHISQRASQAYVIAMIASVGYPGAPEPFIFACFSSIYLSVVVPGPVPQAASSSNMRSYPDVIRCTE